MHPTRRGLLGAAAAAVALVGCVTDDGDGEGGADEDPATDAPTGTDGDTATNDEAGESGTADGDAPTVQVHAHADLGDVLVGPDELTLYMFDRDAEGESASTCYDGCAENWPPLTAEGAPESGDAVDAELATFEREDGTTQVAADGWPLYYFAGDEEPGDANGQGLNEVWWVVDPAGTPIRDGDVSAESATATETESGDSDDGSAGGY